MHVKGGPIEDVGDQLTILLTLKDRVAFTSRWMSYANETRFPFKVLIADGGTDDEASDLLSDGKRFPNVHYEYVRYKPDLGYSDYYSKTADALRRVDTPYVALADNDDFFIAGALGDAVRFLVAHPDYATCGGQGAVFWVLDSKANEDFLFGNKIEWKATFEPNSIDANSATQRLRAQAVSTADTFFYDVKRTAEARRHYDIVRDICPRDLYLFEQVVCFLTAISGKSKRLDGLYLARQRNSPSRSGGMHTERYGDWFGRMLVDTWSDDFSKFVQATSTELAKADGLSEEDARKEIVRCYRMLIAPALLSNILEEPTITLPMSTIVPLVRRLVNMSESSLLKRVARTLYRRAGLISLDFVYGTELLAGRVPNAHRDAVPMLRFLARNRDVD